MRREAEQKRNTVEHSAARINDRQRIPRDDPLDNRWTLHSNPDKVIRIRINLRALGKGVMVLGTH